MAWSQDSSSPKPPQSTNTSSLTQQINASQDPDQLYQLGLNALANNQPDVARQALERVVGLDPRFAGAWLDLALATYRSGDAAAAVEHLEYLRNQFPLTPALLNQVNQWQSLWQNPQNPQNLQTAQRSQPKSSWQGEIQLSAGYDNNANTGLSRLQIPLSLPTGSTLFDVDKAFLPRADSFSLLAATLGGPVWAFGPGNLSPVLLLRNKLYTHETGFNSLDLQPGLVYQQAAGPDSDTAAPSNYWQVNLLAQHYRLGGQTLFNGLRVAVLRNQPWHSCQRILGTEIATRAQQSVPSLSGTLYSLNAGLSCPLPGDGGKSFSANLKTGFEQARADRPGGNNQSAELTLRYEQMLSPSQSLQASWQIATTADQSGYSPLLEDNAKRKLQRQTLSLGLRQSLSADWEARLNLEFFQQRANLPLFEQQGRMLMLGLAKRFN